MLNYNSLKTLVIQLLLPVLRSNSNQLHHIKSPDCAAVTVIAGPLPAELLLLLVLLLQVTGPFLSFNAAMFAFSSLVPLVLLWGGAAALNLSLLTSDLWAAAARVAFFGALPSPGAPLCEPE